MYCKGEGESNRKLLAVQVLVYLDCFACAAGTRFPGPRVKFVDVLGQHSDQVPEEGYAQHYACFEH
jgi:hypothetical protein